MTESLSALNESNFSCLIIGAGMAGLMAAQTLQAQGVAVTLLDKGRSVGGRLATRWRATATGEKAYFDYGAQFFTVREARFQRYVDEWLAAGLVSEWSRGFSHRTGAAQTDVHPRYRVTGGMNALARHLAQGLTIHTHTTVKSVSHSSNHWQVQLTNGELHSSDTLLLTPPVPQTLALLDAGTCALPAAARADLERIAYDPCMALLVELDAPSRLPAPGAVQLQQEPLTWIADNHRKGISPAAYTATLHAGAEFTRAHWDADHETIAQKLLHAASEWLRVPVKSWQVHRWRYSQPVQLHPAPCLFVDEPAPLAFAGDAFGAPRVEGAALSGMAASHALLEWAAR